MIARILIGAFGVLGLLVGLLVTVQRLRLYTRGVVATGRVIAVQTTQQLQPGGPTRVTTAPMIEVRDEAAGSDFRFRSSFGSTGRGLEIGADVRVRYLRDDHETAEIDALLPMWFLPLGSLLAGGLLLWALTRL